MPKSLLKAMNFVPVAEIGVGVTEDKAGGRVDGNLGAGALAVGKGERGYGPSALSCVCVRYVDAWNERDGLRAGPAVDRQGCSARPRASRVR